MLRITCTTSDCETRIIKVEGRIAGEYVAEMSRVVSQALQQVERVSLDMSDVTYVDHAGVALLHSLRGRGIELIECSGFVWTLLSGGTE